jgi:hypothetical protein
LSIPLVLRTFGLVSSSSSEPQDYIPKANTSVPLSGDPYIVPDFEHLLSGRLVHLRPSISALHKLGARTRVKGAAHELKPSPSGPSIEHSLNNDDICHLSVKEILARLKGIITFSHDECQNKDVILTRVLAGTPKEQTIFLQQAGRKKHEEKLREQEIQEATRQHKRADDSAARRIAQRLENVEEEADEVLAKDTYI